MTKRAFLFAGQGAQKLGMASDLYATYPVVKETFDTASRILGYDLRELIDSDEEKLNQTRYTQPAILTTSVAIYRLLAENGITPDIVAGLSLGEYSALVAAGALSFEDAVALVAKRGEFMETAAPAGSGKMVAVMNTDPSLIEEICQKASEKGVVTPANYNTPAQIVIGGEVEAVDYAVELLKEAGAKRLIPLNVSGPFHTALLESASQKLAAELEKVSFNDFTLPFVKDVLKEITALFPAPFIHIGGDEVPKERWSQCDACQKAIRDKGLKDTDKHTAEEYLQSCLLYTSPSPRD